MKINGIFTFVNVRNHFSAIAFLFLVSSGLTAQAGKVQEKTLRLHGHLNLGNYETDWMKRSQLRGLIAGQVGSDWNNQLGLGLKLGGHYFVKLDHSTVNYFFFGLDIQSQGRNQESITFGSQIVASDTYATGLGIIDLNFGLVLWNESNFRIKPKLVISGVNQQVNSNRNAQALLIASNTTINSLGFSSSRSISTANTNMLGSAFEYDLTPNFTLYAELLLISPFLYRVKGEYTAESAGFVGISDGSSGIFYQRNTGAYNISGGKIEIGGTHELSSDMRLQFALSSTAYISKFSDGSGFTLSNIQVRGVGSTSLNVIDNIITEAIVNAQKQTVLVTNLSLGVTKDIIFESKSVSN